LVQGTDNWVGVRGARIVVVDDTGVRARMSAAWLRQMGHKDVFVADNVLGTETGSGLAELAPPVLTITVEQLVKREPGTAVVDLARSIDFRAGHIEHAIWGVRGRLAPVVSKLSSAREIVLTSPDGSLARFAFAEVKDMTSAEVLVLDGGTAAWRAAGHPTVANRADPPDDACIDFYLRAYDRNSGVEEAMNAYLTWEIDLVNEIQRDGTIAFGVAASH
jgi:rhodanese-related sulfurtransferase